MMKMMKFFPVKRVLAVGILWLAVGGAGGEKKAEQIYAMPETKEAASLFVSSRPDVVAVRWDSRGGEGGRGCLVFQVLKPQKELVEIRGPELNLEARSEFTSVREIQMRMQFRFVQAPDDFLQLRFELGKGRYATASTPRRFWETIADPGPRAFEWRNWRVLSRSGKLFNGTTRGRVIFLINAAAGNGEFQLEKLQAEEIVQTDHLFRASADDLVLSGESGQVTIRFAHPENITGGTVVVKNEEGDVLQTEKLPAGQADFVCGLPERGYYELTADMHYKDGRRITSSRSAAVIGPELPEAVRRSSRYGLCRVWGTPEWGRKVGSAVDYSGWSLKTNIRQEKDGSLTWHGKPRTWESAFVTHAAIFDLLPDFLLKPQNRGLGGLYPPADWQKLAEAVQLWAKHTEKLPDVIDLFNEPDAFWRGSREELVKLHNVMTDAIKSARPEAKVGGPGFYSIRMQDFKEYVEKGILRNMDWLVIHAYVNGTPPEQEFIEKIIAMQEYLKTTPYAGLPIAFTEFGWTTPPGDWQKPVTELEKARYCARSLILCTVRDIRHLCYFCGRHGGYSIVNHDYTPRPALASYTTLVRELAPVKSGVWIEFAPGVYGALFPREGKTAGAFWTMKQVMALTLPEPPNYLRSMTGKKLPAVRSATLSPSPVYTEFNDAELSAAAEEAVRRILPGESFDVAGTVVVPPPFLSRTGNRFTASSAAPLGRYSVLTKRDGAWRVVRVEVIRPFEPRFADWMRDGTQGRSVRALFSASSLLPGTVAAEAVLKLEDGRVFRRAVELKNGGGNEFAFPFPAENGRRYRGELSLVVKKPIQWAETCPVDVTPLTVPSYRSPDRVPEWEKVPAFRMNGWDRGDIGKTPLSAAPAEFRMYAAPDGLHLRVSVDDPELNRDYKWSDMWRADSIQAAFDLDAGREWLPNNVGNGFNGHRVVEYAFGYPTTQVNPEAWCYLGYADGVKSGPAFALMKTSSVVRDEAKKRTVYTIRFPWRSLGAERMPRRGERIGFALLVNDRNRDGVRRCIPFFGGIQGKEPQKYGTVSFDDGDAAD